MSGQIDLEVLGVTKSFDSGESNLIALRDVDFEVYQGEFQCIVGPSGCGKSTLLRIMAGLTKPTSGVIKFRGTEIEKPHPKISMVFQTFALLPWKTVFENVELGLKLRGIPKLERHRISKEHIDLVGLKGFENSYPKQLSGGMRQRVGFARALATDPEVVLLDEPFSALDELTANSLRQEVLRLWRDMGKTFVMVTHSISEAVELAKRIVVLSSRPAKVKDIVGIEMPWPRKRASPDFESYESRVFSLLKEDLNKLYDMENEEA